MGGNSSKAKRDIDDLRGRNTELEQRLSTLSSLSVPQWRLGDRKYYDLHESAWECVLAQNKTAGGAQAAHPSEARLNVGGTTNGVLSFDNSAPYGDDLVLSALLLLRKTEKIHTLSMTNSGLTDAGADLLATAIRVYPAAPSDVPNKVRCGATRLVLKDNAAVTGYGARQLLAAFLTRPSAALNGGVVDFSGCPAVFTGPKDDVALFEACCDRLQKTPGFTLVLPPRPEVPFVIDGQEVRLSAFKGDRGEYAPLQVGASTWLHREDIKLKTAEKAESLLHFLQALHAEQVRLGGHGSTPMSHRRPFEAGSCFLAKVAHVELRAGTQVVAVIKAPQGKTYAQLMQDSEQSGVPVPRSIRLQVFMQVCAAVAYSHTHSFAMRTLRPDLLLVALDHGMASCQYLDYCALRPESLRSIKVQLGCRMAFTDPSVRAGSAISRSMDSYAAAMMVVYSYSFTDSFDDFKQRQYVWLKEAQRPVADQVPDALAHYQGRLKIDADVAELVVAMTRPDDKRMSCADAAKAFFGLIQAESRPAAEA